MTYAMHAETCALYIRTHSLNLNVTDAWAQRLDAFCKGLAAGNLYLYGEATGNAAYLDHGRTQGQDVLNWLNVAPLTRLRDEY
jgi:hypothetical protein